MSKRVRTHAMTALMAPVGFAYASVAGDWGDLVFFAVGACVAAVVCLIAMFWTEYAPEGAFRRRPSA